MRILFSVHLYPPTHNCGGEYFIHNLSKYLISKGHQVRVLLHQAHTYGITGLYDYEGVTVFPPGSNEYLVLWADIILSHLEYTSWTINVGRIFKRPVVFISHNTAFEAYDCVRDNPEVGIIYNCNAMREQSPFTNDSIVLHPAIDSTKVAQNNSGEYITMINCNENKGGKIFSRVAAAMPGRKFLAVKGSYDEQFIADLPNIKVVENSPDILTVYKQTRILLMPSRYESWGMTATEAMANGIPVICTPTFGLKENCAEAGIFVPERGPLVPGVDCIDDDGETYDIGPIISAIKKLDNKKEYQRQRELCLKRAKELDPEKELGETENFLIFLQELMMTP